MDHKELNDTPEAAESSERRSFLKGMVAGTVAAGSVAAGSLLSAVPANAAPAPQISDTAAARHVRIAFNRNRPPSLPDVYRAVEVALGKSGCTRCGFVGIDLFLRVEDIIDPYPQEWVITSIPEAGY